MGDAASASAPTTPKHSFPYFEDGNIVISASTSKRRCKVFRVHKSVLAFHSHVFADMFTLPTLPDNTTMEMYDGVPLVHLPDPAEEVAELFTLLYKPSALRYDRRDPCLPLDLEPLLTLCRKYGLDDLLARLLHEFESAWPQTLTQWDALEAEIALEVEAYKEGRDDSQVYVDRRYPEPIAAIQLAREFEIDTIPPVAFYHLSRLEIDLDYDVIHGYDDTTSQRQWDKLFMGLRSARWGALSAADFRLVLRGRERLSRLHQNLIHEFFRKSNFSSCPGENCCVSTSIEFMAIAERLSAEKCNDLLQFMKVSFMAPEMEKRGFCHNCALKAQNIIGWWRETLWDNLGKVFIEEQIDEYGFWS
ncbi:hypothetical protein JAAARDRAFT_595770 [Jaapia argillacea MUCL 33604]|uniref:BTB domain-containing protein n=1 Tax=Jaapia argillacea MUCL 33604 TaxID=933084 RepID=A0A067Q1R1_9AGAM|nr:hypothetical protein JAAARDRAFT_595770 [Jaapia argillacea MUCL 33604]